MTDDHIHRKPIPRLQVMHTPGASAAILRAGTDWYDVTAADLRSIAKAATEVADAMERSAP